MATLRHGEGWMVASRAQGLRWVASVAVIVALLSLAAAAGAADHQVSDQRLSTTLLGRLEPSGEPRLAVRWDGPPGALLDAWVDLDGDGVPGEDELVVAGRSLEPGIEVVELEIAAEAYVDAEPRLSVRVREGGSAELESDGEKSPDVASAGSCVWKPGFIVSDLDSIVRTAVVYDEGTGPRLYVGGDFTAADGRVVNHVASWDGTAWSALHGPLGTGVDDSVHALVVFDDGGGPALYVGGEFITAGGVTVNHVAKWDGTSWSALSGSGGTGMDDAVYALAAYDDGSGADLYAGGSFVNAGGLTANRIARWSGGAWSALSGPGGSGVDHTVYALGVFDDGTEPALYAGGRFATAGSVTVNCIAKWDGALWSALSGPSGTGMDYWVLSLAVFDDGTGEALYAGGWFNTAGGVTVNSVARWDGSAWSPLSGPSGTGMGDSGPPVDALAVFDDGTGPALFAGGAFNKAGGVVVSRIAKWDGSEWSFLAGPTPMRGTDRPVRALVAFDDGTGPALYAGGDFLDAGGVIVNRVARWDGSVWSELSHRAGAGLDGAIRALQVYDYGFGPALHAGGDFRVAGGMIVNHVARWDGSGWSALSDHGAAGTDDIVNAFAVDDHGSWPYLYAGGFFISAGGEHVYHVARWSIGGWQALSGPSDTGTSDLVFALDVYDDGTGPTVYAGGRFSRAGGVTANNIAKWDGNAWSALSGPSGTGTNDSVRALAVFDDGVGPALYAGGSFTRAGGVPVSRVARWDGSAWSALSSIGGDVLAFAVYDDGTGPALYVGGEFDRAGGVLVRHIAKWDGTAWSALFGPAGTGTNDDVLALAVYDDGMASALYVGGRFTTAGGVTANGVAKWDGSAWSALAGAVGTGTNRDVRALAVFDDGTGPVLHMGGSFTTAGGLASSRIAAWCCDSLPPADPSTLWSPTHPVGEWFTADVVEVEWSGATEIGCSGLDGYSVVFDTEPKTLPDTVVDIHHASDPHVTTSGGLTDGANHWFHLRTCDLVGNCSDGVHLGPFRVDSTAPSGPSDLESTSHTPGIPSCERSVDMVWTPATDAGSGLDGYSWAVSRARAWTCDQVKDLEEWATSLTTPELGDAVWYVHLCAGDILGHWGDAVTAGPYPICPLFADGFESGDTAAWDSITP